LTEQDVRKNSPKEKMLRGERTIHGWCAFGSSSSAELLGHTGVDSVTVVMQHGMFDFSGALGMLQALLATPTVPIVRVPWNDAADGMHMLDARVYGIICPMINNRAEAEVWSLPVDALRQACEALDPLAACCSAVPTISTAQTTRSSCLR
jgi:2-keto-3-deoxy-L-rhamnonate aldolase RhmA